MLLNLYLLTLSEFPSSRGVRQPPVWLGKCTWRHPVCTDECEQRRRGSLRGLGWRLGSPTTKIGWECLALGASFPVTLFTEMQSLNISILYFSKLWSVQLHPAQLHQASSLITNGL